MATGTLPPTGLARRERRLSDQETERRMLGAALAVVSRTGLTVSLDHLSFEDIIRDADVSRSAVYRRWPYKDLFFSDLVKQLALDAAPGVVADELQLMK
jgi:AcrR family transcriptional regulator